MLTMLQNIVPIEAGGEEHVVKFCHAMRLVINHAPAENLEVRTTSSIVHQNMQNSPSRLCSLKFSRFCGLSLGLILKMLPSIWRT